MIPTTFLRLLQLSERVCFLYNSHLPYLVLAFSPLCSPLRSKQHVAREMIIYSATALGIKHLGYLYSKDHEQVTAYRTDIPYRFQLRIFVYRLVRDHSVSGQALIAGCIVTSSHSGFARTKAAEHDRNVYHSSAISNAWLWHG